MLIHDPQRLADGTSTRTASRVVVIGAGAVGLYAASLLAARGSNVVVVEAGKSYLDSFANQSYCTVGRPHDGIRLARGRCVGGTTNLWGGQLVEFQRLDFDGRQWLPESKWPVCYDEIAPYYKTTYHNLGLPRSVHEDQDIWRGIACTRPDLGPEFEVFLTRWLGIPNFAQLFAKQIETDERMTVLAGHTAVGFRGNGTHVTSVRVVNDEGRSHWIDAELFVLAAGTIENSRLLLHTAQDHTWPPPWRDNDNIGRYFQDHLGGRIGPFKPTDKRRFLDMFCHIVYAGHNFHPKIRLRDEPLQRHQIFNTQGIFAFEGKAAEHLVYAKQFLRSAFYSRQLSGCRELLRNGLGAAKYVVPLIWTYLWDHRVFVPSSTNIFFCVQAEHGTCAESRIRIDNTQADSYGLPTVILDWRLGGRELVSLRDYAIQVAATLRSSGIGDLIIDDDLLSLDPRFLSKLRDTYHQAGGTVMASSDREGVVDKNLRVFGTANLYVTGASVFPTASSANTTFTALTFTTRLADHLSTDGHSLGLSNQN
jgi:choline dehydrogenase-like flavoprotein